MADKAEHTACVKPTGPKTPAALSGVGIGSALSLALCMTRRLDSGLDFIGIAAPTVAVYCFLAGMAAVCGVVLAKRPSRQSQAGPHTASSGSSRTSAIVLCLACMAALLGLFIAPKYIALICSAALGASIGFAGIKWFARASELDINNLVYLSCIAIALTGISQALFKIMPTGGTYVFMAALALFTTLGLVVQTPHVCPAPETQIPDIDRESLISAIGASKMSVLNTAGKEAARVLDVLALSWIAVASLAFCGFITGLTFDPLLSDETTWREASVEVAGSLVGAALTCVILALLGGKGSSERRLRLLVGAALPTAIALLIVIPVVKLMVEGPLVAIVTTILSASSFSLISAVACIEIASLARTLAASAPRCAAAILLICCCCAALGMTLINVVGTGGRMLCFLLEAVFFTAVVISYALMTRPGSSLPAASGANETAEMGAETDLAQRCGSLAQQKGLSPRETDVLLLLARGYGSTHIANELGISENTVRTHVRHIYEKLGVGGREALIALVDSL